MSQCHVYSHHIIILMSSQIVLWLRICDVSMYKTDLAIVSNIKISTE